MDAPGRQRMHKRKCVHDSGSPRLRNLGILSERYLQFNITTVDGCNQLRELQQLPAQQHIRKLGEVLKLFHAQL